jgi:hypothetical protein
MSTIRDLRDLVSVSRLTFREENSGEENSDNNEEEPQVVTSKRNVSGKEPVKLKSRYQKLAPIMSDTQPGERKPRGKLSTTDAYTLNSYRDLGNSSISLTSRDSLLDRETIPVVNHNGNGGECSPKIVAASGNFDSILAYIDASVVSDWLNRANRSLKKMLKWHRNGLVNASLSSASSFVTTSYKYESFVNFCNFWLGFNETVRLSDKQRRDLIEMEYSIVYDEVLHAFQVGIESNFVSLNDVHSLLKAVLREYPLQLLSFRGTYLLLDYIDILSSERHHDYKRLLSDVKCRTVNKQYAQWLLSIRSFALINMCWSIVKFFEKTTNIDQTTSIKVTKDEATKTTSTKIVSSSSSSVSSSGSSRSSSSAAVSSNNMARAKSAKSKSTQANDDHEDTFNLIIPKSLKYEFYLDAVMK